MVRLPQRKADVGTQVAPVSLRGLAKALRAEGPVFLLETQTPWQGRSFLATRPAATLKVYGSEVEYTQATGESVSYRGSPWEALRQFRARHGMWTFCVLGYDLKNADESLASMNHDCLGLPDLYAICPTLVLLGEDARITEILGELGDIEHAGAGPYSVGVVSSTDEKQSYLERIARVKHDIHEGEYYELNLSHPLTADFVGDPMGLYEAMASDGPVPMAAFVGLDEVAVCCASPERYLRRTGSMVISEPIKGTRPRSTDPHEDARLRNGLAESVKDRAENLMIVDLVRNDLARVALPGSVQTTELFGIRSYATVHQMVSTVQARVPQETDPVDILRTTFPMGSMTGAPKIRVMKAIEEYETYRRGWYSGAIGYITPDGDFDFNVVIRTAMIRGKQLIYPVGGAVTSDSEPEAEWEETWVKAKALEN